MHELTPLFSCRPILTLPPANIEVKYCDLSESEQDFYEALFRRSKVVCCQLKKDRAHAVMQIHSLCW